MSKIVKFFSLFGVLVIGFSVLVGAGTSAYAEDQVIDDSEISIEELQQYLYCDDNGRSYFDIDQAKDLKESLFVLDIGENYNALSQLDDGTIEGRRRVTRAILDGVKLYGNYCGKGTNFDTAGNPIDQLDKYCMYHDLCYGARGWGNKQCDIEFVANLTTGLRNKTIKGAKARAFANAAILYFANK